MPKDLTNYLPLIDIDTAKLNPLTWDAILEFSAMQNLARLLYPYVERSKTSSPFHDELYIKAQDTYHKVKNGELEWLTEDDLNTIKPSNIYSRVNTVIKAFNSNLPKQKSAVDLIAHLAGEDRPHALESIASKLNIKKNHITPDKNSHYPKGIYATQKLEPELPFEILKHHSSNFELYAHMLTRNSSGKPSGLISVFRNQNDYIAIPFKIKEAFRTSTYSFEWGITSTMLDFYNRDDFKTKPDATIILTDSFFIACTLNYLFSEENISSYVATSCFGGVNTLLRPDYSYLTDRDVTLLLSPEGLKSIDHIVAECEKYETASLKVSPEFENIINYLKEHSISCDCFHLLDLINKTVSYEKTTAREEIENYSHNYSDFKTLVVSDPPTQNNQEMYWDTFITPGEITLLYGPTDIGKTIFTYSLAAAFASRIEFYNLSVQEPKKVLYIDGETTEENARSYAMRISSYLKNSPHNLKLHLNKNSNKKYFFNDADEYLTFTNELNKFDVIILDNILSLAAETLRSPTKWEQFRKWLSNLSAAVILLHHENDDAKIAGPTLIKSLIPTQLHLTASKTAPLSPGAVFDIYFEKNKTYPQLKNIKHRMHLAFEGDSDWEINLSSEIRDGNRPEQRPAQLTIPEHISEVARIIIDHAIKKGHPFSRAEAEHWIDKKEGATRTYLNELTKAELLIQMGEGKATRYAIRT